MKSFILSPWRLLCKESETEKYWSLKKKRGNLKPKLHLVTAWYRCRRWLSCRRCVLTISWQAWRCEVSEPITEQHPAALLKDWYVSWKLQLSSLHVLLGNRFSYMYQVTIEVLIPAKYYSNISGQRKNAFPGELSWSFLPSVPFMNLLYYWNPAAGWARFYQGTSLYWMRRVISQLFEKCHHIISNYRLQMEGTYQPCCLADDYQAKRESSRILYMQLCIAATVDLD